jgi:ketosteroid isomerase-like protein
MTATQATHIDAVNGLYAAFGRGDIPAILELVADDIRWEHWADSFVQRADVPSLKARGGREGVAEFFGEIAAWDVTEFSVLDLMAGDRQVVAEIVIDATLPNGGRFRDEELHLWGFNDEGKIDRMRHYVDTAKHIAAENGEDTVASAR